mgnify:CR=1 FL=1
MIIILLKSLWYDPFNLGMNALILLILSISQNAWKEPWMHSDIWLWPRYFSLPEKFLLFCRGFFTHHPPPSRKSVPHVRLIQWRFTRGNLASAFKINLNGSFLLQDFQRMVNRKRMTAYTLTWSRHEGKVPPFSLSLYAKYKRSIWHQTRI